MMFTFSLDGGSRNIFSLAAMNIMSDRLTADGTTPSDFEVVQDQNKESCRMHVLNPHLPYTQ